jgi:transcriptional regulator with XRE-family HTH domain
MSRSNSRLKDFGKVVRKMRVSKGLSQEAFAEITGIHRTYVGGIERGERNPSLLMIHRIAEALEVAPAELFSREF